jgi:hypothetical protein
VDGRARKSGDEFGSTSVLSKPLARIFWSDGETESRREASINPFTFRPLLRKFGARRARFAAPDDVVFLQLLPHK